MQKFKHRAVSTGVSKQRALAAVPENEEELKDDELAYTNAFQRQATRRLSVRNSDPSQLRADPLGETSQRQRLHHALTTNLNENNTSSNGEEPLDSYILDQALRRRASNNLPLDRSGRRNRNKSSSSITSTNLQRR